MAGHQAKLDGHHRSRSGTAAILSGRGKWKMMLRLRSLDLSKLFIGGPVLRDVLHRLSVLFRQHFRRVDHYHIPGARRGRVVGGRFGQESSPLFTLLTNMLHSPFLETMH